MTRIPPILVVALFGGLAALSVMKVRFSSDIYQLLPQDLPEVRGMEQINRFFGRHGQLMVTVQGESPWAVEAASASLATHLQNQENDVDEVYRELSLEQLVADGGGLLAWTWLNARPDALAELSERLSPDRSRTIIEHSFESVQNSFSAEDAFMKSYDPLGFSTLDAGAANADPMRSRSGLFEVLYVEGRGVDFSDYRAADVWLGRIRESVAEWSREWQASRPPEEGVQIGLTGTPAFMAEVGTEMEKDMTVSVVATLVLISVLFFLMHRQLRPLSWLLAAMLAALAVTLTVGNLLYGDLSVMSVGFAAILMGLAVDYGIVLYREAMDSGSSAADLRRSVGPAILWAAATTGLVFVSLNLSAFPGLAEMGNLVAIGVLVGALIMLFLFAPVAVSFSRLHTRSLPERVTDSDSTGRGALMAGLAMPLLAGGAMFLGEAPKLEASFHPFRIRESPSMKAWQEHQVALRGQEHAAPTVVTGDSFAELHGNLRAAGARISSAKQAGLVTRFLLPTDWIPNPAHQRNNAGILRALLEERTRLLAELDEAGFSEEGVALTNSIFGAWESLLDTPSQNGVTMPADRLGKWSIDRVFRDHDGELAALAAVTPASPGDRDWVDAICDEHTNVASLPSLGTALNQRIGGDLTSVFLPIIGLLTVMLALVFRSWRDLLLSLYCLIFAGAALIFLTAFSLLEWNSFNVCGLPLLFGTGLDFSIHMIFALRRAGGEVKTVRRGMGKALIFCGTSSAIGFGSLATASAHGLSSLGIVCAVGILINMIVAVVLLPRWYRWLHRGRHSRDDKPTLSV